MKLSEIDLRPPKILLMGQYGTGKTALACTLGEYCQVLDLDEGLLTCLTFEDKFQETRSKIDIVPCYETKTFTPNAFHNVAQTVADIHSQCKKGTYPFKALVIDGLTNLTNFAMDYVLYNSGMIKPDYSNSSNFSAKGKLLTAPGVHHWGARDALLQRFLMYLKALPIVVVLIAHTMITTLDDVSIITLACKGQKFPPEVPGNFSEVWRTYVRAKKFVIQTKSTPIFPARTRANLETDIEQDLGMIEILKKCGYDITKE